MLYITQTRLMRESEQTVLERANSDDEIARRICSQLLDDSARYAQWHARHEIHMGGVASARRHERQVLKLRAIAIEQVHRTALVRYLRDNHVVGAERDRTLRALYGINDIRDSTLAEHRTYLLAASTQLCTSDIHDLVGDDRGQGLLRRYELAYGQYFGMFCDRARAIQHGRGYLLTAFIPEVRSVAERMRLKILDMELLPVRPISMLGAALARDARGEAPRRTAAGRTAGTRADVAAALPQKPPRARRAQAAVDGANEIRSLDPPGRLRKPR